jgi:hypothetical protein
MRQRPTMADETACARMDHGQESLQEVRLRPLRGLRRDSLWDSNPVSPLGQRAAVAVPPLTGLNRWTRRPSSDSAT